jgi:hypothetical protein
MASMMLWSGDFVWRMGQRSRWEDINIVLSNPPPLATTPTQACTWLSVIRSEAPAM